MIQRSNQVSPRTRGPRRSLNVGLWLLSSLSLVACGRHHTPGNAIDAMDVIVPDGGKVTDGSVRLEVSAEDCPQVTVTASPDVAHVGDRIAVVAIASDDDPNDHLTYAWTASAGTLANPTLATTTYACPGAGPQTLTVAVSDGVCATKRSATITCYAAADAGSGGAGGSGAGGAGGSAGGIDAGDAGGVDSAGGAGGGGMGGAGGSCAGDDPTKCEGELCDQCTYGVADGQTDLCSATADGCFNCDPATMGCDIYASSGPRLAKCYALYTCFRDSHCNVLGGDLPCWCGSTPNSQCVSGAAPATGPCVQQIIDAAESSDPGTINARFIDPTYPLGGAFNLAYCRAQSCGRSGDSADPQHPSCPLW